MTTNGILLNKYIDFLALHNFLLTISLDGNEYNNSYRVTKKNKESFNLIMRNIYLLNEKYPSYFTNRVTFNAVIHNRNSVSEVYHFFKNNFSKTPLVSGLSTQGIAKAKTKEFWEMFNDIGKSFRTSDDIKLIIKDNMLNPDRNNLEDVLFSLSGNFYKNSNQLINYKSENAGCATGTCIPFSRDLFLTVESTIIQCVMISQDFVLGDVDDNVNIDFNKIADKINAWYAKIIKQCKVCYNASNCAKCIFSLDLSKKNVICDDFMNYENYSNYLADTITYLENQSDNYKLIMEEFKIDN